MEAGNIEHRDQSRKPWRLRPILSIYSGAAMKGQRRWQRQQHMVVSTIPTCPAVVLATSCNPYSNQQKCIILQPSRMIKGVDLVTPAASPRPAPRTDLGRLRNGAVGGIGQARNAVGSHTFWEVFEVGEICWRRGYLQGERVHIGACPAASALGHHLRESMLARKKRASKYTKVQTFLVTTLVWLQQ